MIEWAAEAAAALLRPASRRGGKSSLKNTIQVRSILIQVRFSAQETGACPLCKSFEYCPLLAQIRQAVESGPSGGPDEVLEVVIYRCPRFKESHADHVPADRSPGADRSRD